MIKIFVIMYVYIIVLLSINIDKLQGVDIVYIIYTLCI